MSAIAFRRSVAAQVAATVAVVAALNGAAIGVGMAGLARIEARLAHLVEVDTVKSDSVADMRLAVVARVDRVRNIALTPDVDRMQADQREIEALVARYRERRTALLALPLDGRETELLETEQALYTGADGLMKQAQALARMMQPDAAAQLLTERLAPLQARWIETLEALAAVAAESRNAQMEQASVARRWTWAAMLGSGAAALALGALLTRHLALRLGRRLAAARDVTQRIAEGDLRELAMDSGDDEIGQLLRSVHTMQQRLRDIAGGIRQAADSIRTASGEIASGNQDLSQRTERQAASLEATASSMNEIAAAVCANADSANRARSLAEHAAACAESGSCAVERVVDSMHEIQRENLRIGEIVGLIDGFAFQTNLLALNAAVEAARAGEQGRGFSVVAGAVRELAQRSAQAARQVKELVHTSTQRVDTGALRAAEAGQQIAELVLRFGQLQGLVVEIAGTTGAQTQAIAHVNTTVHQLDESTQRNAALVEQSAAAAASLRDQARGLTSAIGVFRLADG